MADDPTPVELTTSCNYQCDGEEYVLVGGTAPEGYTCPAVLGPCEEGDVGDTKKGFPVLNAPNPVDPPAIEP